ncbi:MAG: hypothetical protein ACHP7N_02500 [Caulobacterales bacterium]
MSWTDTGPITLPPKPVAYTAAGILAVVAILGVGLGVRASWRDARPSVDSGDQVLGGDQAILAKPIVEIPAAQQQAAAANTVAANSAADQPDETADSNAIAAQTAAASAKSAKVAIDQSGDSGAEKPQAAARPSVDEGEPGSPQGAKTDVPF